LAVVVDERALRRPVGGPEVMAQQLRRLADSLRDDLSAVRFHVAPATLVSPGILRGPFSVLGFADELDQDVVFLEADDHPTYLETDDHVQRYEAVFESLVKECLDSAESIAILDRIAKAMESEVAADAVS
ncbi:MAG: transcriptional regulator, partial [Pseudonocardia sp.]|nr:transcriptional regulator [Pseudonocardia sp.]